jgi:DNA-binding response OmpR family regulator
MTKVIVIDDEEDIRIALRETFACAGFEVEVASNGKEGMDLLRRHGADLTLTKPFDREELIKAAKELTAH